MSQFFYNCLPPLGQINNNLGLTTTNKNIASTAETQSWSEGTLCTLITQTSLDPVENTCIMISCAEVSNSRSIVQEAFVLFLLY